MKTLKITTDKKISIVDVDFKDFRSIQQAVGGYFETVKTRKMWDYFKAPVIMLVDEEGLIKGLSCQCSGFCILWNRRAWLYDCRRCDLRVSSGRRYYRIWQSGCGTVDGKDVKRLPCIAEGEQS